MVSTLVEGLGVGLGVIIVAFGIYVLALRSSHHYTSTLTCPKCKSAFEYKWVPLASFTSVRLGTSRYLQCPVCHEWSTFNIIATRNKGDAQVQPYAQLDNLTVKT